MSTLKHLFLVVSKSTTNAIYPKEALLEKYLPQRSWTRIKGALGFEELVDLTALGRLKNVKVEDVDNCQAHRRSEDERNGLEKLLQAHAGERHSTLRVWCRRLAAGLGMVSSRFLGLVRVTRRGGQKSCETNGVALGEEAC
ncbi:hypothetical protein LA080_003280 [Diaporthe eres]|nr:hypothetical protein LA080_003280 [Diaporthe eres]